MSSSGDKMSWVRPSGVGFGRDIEDLVGVESLQPFGREGRSSAIAKEPFQSASVVGLDAYAGIEGEPAAVIPVLHLLAISLVQQPSPLIGTQNAASHVHLHRLGVLRIQRWYLGEA